MVSLYVRVFTVFQQQQYTVIQFKSILFFASAVHLYIYASIIETRLLLQPLQLLSRSRFVFLISVLRVKQGRQ